MMNLKALRRASTLVLFGVLSLSTIAFGQEKPYTEGTVWFITMIRVKPGMFDVYMRDLLPMRKSLEAEAKKQGLIVSSHILSGNAMGRGDWDLMLMVEYKNWAALDGLSAKYDAILSKVVGSEEKQAQVMMKRADVREIMGEKTMQEVLIK